MAHENMMESISQKFCPTCGKTFTVLWPLQWGYRRGEGANRKYFCSWSCIRLFDKGETKMGLTKVTDAQKAKAVEIAIEGGDPIKYLDETGGTENAAGMWFTIKKKLKETDPDTYDRLPAKYKPVQKKTASDAMKGMQDAADKFFGQCQDMGLLKEEGKAGDDLETTAVRDRNLGEFYFDHDHNCIDWRNGLGDEVSLGPSGWKMMIEKLPKILMKLGVKL